MSATAATPHARRRARACAQAMCLTGFLGFALTQSGCAEECNGCTDINLSPTPDPNGTPPVGFADEHPKTWAMMRQIYQQVLVYAAPPLITQTRWYDQVSWSYFLVTWEELPDGRVQQHETLCSADLSEIAVATTRGTQQQDILVPEGLISRLPTQTWTGYFEETGAPGDPTYSVVYGLEETEHGPQYTVWGAQLSDPVQESCPLSAGAPEFDQDEDNSPGVTTKIIVEGSEFTETYICQRLNFRHAEGVVSETESGYRIQGELLDVVNDQTQFGASNPVFPNEDPEVQWKGSQSFYQLISLPEGSTCASVLPELFDQTLE